MEAAERLTIRLGVVAAVAVDCMLLEIAGRLHQAARQVVPVVVAAEQFMVFLNQRVA